MNEPGGYSLRPPGSRQDLIDAILELTRDPQMQTWGWTYALLRLDSEQLGDLLEALSDYDEVRNLAGAKRAEGN